MNTLPKENLLPPPPTGGWGILTCPKRGGMICRQFFGRQKLRFAAKYHGFRDECRRRLAQGDFDISGGNGGGGGAASSLHLPGGKITESPVADVNSLLTGTHLQVGDRDR